MSDDCSPLVNFQGVARLFPLPNLVLFPHVMQPLHIFEPRYRQMTADALAGDRLIAMALLKPGWESQYADSPAVHSVACLGKIMAEQGLEDGRYNILLHGQHRIQIEREVPGCKLYRRAHVDLLADLNEPSPKRLLRWRRRLLRSLPPWLPEQKEVREQFAKLFDKDLPLGALCDIIAFALPLDVELKQHVLEQLDVQERARTLLRQLQAKTAPPATEAERTFPPEFSVN